MDGRTVGTYTGRVTPARRTRIAVALAVLGAVATLGTSAAAGGPGDGPAGAGAPAISAVRFSMEPSFSAYLGGRVAGTVIVVIANPGAGSFDAVLPRVHAGGSTVYAQAVDVGPFEVVESRARVELDGPSWTTKLIEAEALGTAGTTTHRTIPWVSIVLVALVLNATLLAVRDALRDTVAQRIGRSRV